MQLKASPRQPLGKRSRRMLREGKLPAIVYGHNTEATPITLDRLEFQKVFVKSGRTHLVDLVLDGDRTEKVLVREIQTHPRRSTSTSTRSTCRRRSRSTSQSTWWVNQGR